MLLRLMLLLIICLTSVSMERIIIYNHARFEPTDVRVQLIDILSVRTQNACICQCYSNSSCLTTTFIGINETCILVNASLSQGQVRVMINSSASVISFPNRIINTNLINPPAIIEWLFDGDFNDTYGRYNGNLIDYNTVLWMSPGYAGYGNAVYFPFNNYSLIDSYLDLTTSSFTISAWIWIPYNITLNGYDFFTLFSHCQDNTQDKCLHIAIQNGKLYFGFFDDDLEGATRMNSNQWYHIAYVYDRSTSEQFVYLNGNIDGNRTPRGSYIGNASQVTIGAIPQFSWVSFRSGYIDKVIFVSRIKNDSELLDEATLVAYYSYDNTYLDFGPNQINNSSGINTTFDTSGRFNQSLVIDSIYSSYFQTTGFYYLGQTNYSYSFSLWIYPFSNTGTILQVTSSNGWCVPMIGFSTTEHLTIQTLGSNGTYATSLFNETLPLNIWTHISMTYSIINGIQLFVNGSLVGFNSSSTDYLASGEFSTVITGTCLHSDICAINQTKIVPAQFRGKIDEFKIFSRELTPNEIQQLALF